jgi:iron complex transport system ATP-binding protein
MSLTASQLEVRYGDTLAVRPVDLAMQSGELIGLIGPNGAGKTSLLRALAGIPAASEQVRWQGRKLSELDRDERARTIAYLPQSPQANWPLSVGELVELGRLPHRRFGQRFGAADRDVRSPRCPAVNACVRIWLAPLQSMRRYCSLMSRSQASTPIISSASCAC